MATRTTPPLLRTIQENPFGAARSASRERSRIGQQSFEERMERLVSQFTDTIASFDRRLGAVETRIDTMESAQRQELNARQHKDALNDERIRRLERELLGANTKIRDLTSLLKVHTHPYRYAANGGLAHECTQMAQETGAYPNL